MGLQIQIDGFKEYVHDQTVNITKEPNVPSINVVEGVVEVVLYANNKENPNKLVENLPTGIAIILSRQLKIGRTSLTQR